VAAQQIEEDRAKPGTQSISNLLTADDFNYIVPDNTDVSHDE